MTDPSPSRFHVTVASSFVVLALTGGAMAFAADPLYRANFERDFAGRWVTYGGTWQPDASELSVRGTRGPRALLADLNIADFELEVEVQAENATQAGVVFRVTGDAKGPDAYDGYYVGISTKASHVVWGASHHRWSVIARRPMEIHPHRWYRLRLLVRGENVKIFVDGLPVRADAYPVFDGVDRQFAKGQIGLRVLGGEATFRRLVIHACPPPEAGRTYTNPVQPGGADPVVLKHEGRYYLYCTSTVRSPRGGDGIRMFSSADLVDWRDHGFVLQREDSWGNKNFWAPEVIARDGTFYLYYAAETRICVATSDSPWGPFRQREMRPMEPDTVRIDPHVFLDDDGQYYFYYVAFDRGNEIWGGRLNQDMTTLDQGSLRRMIRPDQPWEQQMGRIVEGAEVIKHKGTYYLTYSGSHFKSPDYAVGYATSDSPLGPWKKYEQNPIMKSTAWAHGTGHHCLTTSPDDKEMIIVYHRHHDLRQAQPRKLALDRIRFAPRSKGPDGLEVWGPTSSPQPVPSALR